MISEIECQNVLECWLDMILFFFSLPQLDSQLASKKGEYTKYVADSKAKIADINLELDKWAKLRPITEMTAEECLKQLPEQKLVYDPQRKSYWPHEEDYEDWLKRVREEQAKLGDHH